MRGVVAWGVAGLRAPAALRVLLGCKRLPRKRRRAAGAAGLWAPPDGELRFVGAAAGAPLTRGSLPRERRGEKRIMLNCSFATFR